MTAIATKGDAAVQRPRMIQCEMCGSTLAELKRPNMVLQSACSQVAVRYARRRSGSGAGSLGPLASLARLAAERPTVRRDEVGRRWQTGRALEFPSWSSGSSFSFSELPGGALSLPSVSFLSFSGLSFQLVSAGPARRQCSRLTWRCSGLGALAFARAARSARR